MRLTTGGFAALCLLACTTSAFAEAPAWKEIFPGVWKATVGTPEDYDLLKAAGAEPFTESLRNMSSQPFPLDQSAIDAHRTGTRTVLSFPLALDENIYGLGVDFNSMRRTGMTFQLHEDHWKGIPGRTHAPDPFYVSTKGYGVFINTARYVNVNVGLAVGIDDKTKPPAIDRNAGKGWAANPRADSLQAAFTAPGADIYLFAGPTPMDVVRRFNLLCGGGGRSRPNGVSASSPAPPRSTPPTRRPPKSPNSASRASPSTCSASSPAGNPAPTPALSNGTKPASPTPPPSSRRSMPSTST